MNTEAFHPDQLKPGDMVGPWRIVESLGSGSFGHAFKTECEGELFTLKMGVRPAPELPQDTPEKTREERQVDGRMCHEGAILLANTSHPGLPHLRGVGRWPPPKRGYFFFVTDYIPGEPFHTWRERARPTAAQLVDLFIEVVRVVARLHGRGIFIRDFKSEHVIVPEDLKPVLVDLGSAWLPGGSSLTVGLAPGSAGLRRPSSSTPRNSPRLKPWCRPPLSSRSWGWPPWKRRTPGASSAGGGSCSGWVPCWWGLSCSPLRGCGLLPTRSHPLNPRKEARLCPPSAVPRLSEPLPPGCALPSASAAPRPSCGPCRGTAPRKPSGA